MKLKRYNGECNFYETLDGYKLIYKVKNILNKEEIGVLILIDTRKKNKYLGTISKNANIWIRLIEVDVLDNYYNEVELLNCFLNVDKILDLIINYFSKYPNCDIIFKNKYLERLKYKDLIDENA